MMQHQAFAFSDETSAQPGGGLPKTASPYPVSSHNEWDPFVSRALGLLHKDVARQWAVDTLGREVGLSRLMGSRVPIEESDVQTFR
jgi:hypothetical protein